MRAVRNDERASRVVERPRARRRRSVRLEIACVEHLRHRRQLRRDGRAGLHATATSSPASRRRPCRTRSSRRLHCGTCEECLAGQHPAVHRRGAGATSASSSTAACATRCVVPDYSLVPLPGRPRSCATPASSRPAAVAWHGVRRARSCSRVSASCVRRRRQHRARWPSRRRAAWASTSTSRPRHPHQVAAGERLGAGRPSGTLRRRHRRRRQRIGPGSRRRARPHRSGRVVLLGVYHGLIPFPGVTALVKELSIVNVDGLRRATTASARPRRSPPMLAADPEIARIAHHAPLPARRHRRGVPGRQRSRAPVRSRSCSTRSRDHDRPQRQGRARHRFRRRHRARDRAMVRPRGRRGRGQRRPRRQGRERWSARSRPKAARPSPSSPTAATTSRSSAWWPTPSTRSGGLDIAVNNIGMLARPRCPRRSSTPTARTGATSSTRTSSLTALCARRRSAGDGRRRARRRHPQRELRRDHAAVAVHGPVRRVEGRASTTSRSRWRSSSGAHGIRVNAIAPGTTLTEKVREVVRRRARAPRSSSRPPLRRMVEHDELARLVGVPRVGSRPVHHRSVHPRGRRGVSLANQTRQPQHEETQLGDRPTTPSQPQEHHDQRHRHRPDARRGPPAGPGRRRRHGARPASTTAPSASSSSSRARRASSA